MPLHITILDSSNYPQLVVVEETTIEQDRAKWEQEKEGAIDKPTKVFDHIQCYNSQGSGEVLDIINSLCKMYQFNRQFRSILGQVFQAGRNYERKYPEGRGSQNDKRVYRDGDEIEFFVAMQPDRLYRKSKAGLVAWTGTTWSTVPNMSGHAGPADERIARSYLKEISKAVEQSLADEQIEQVLFAA